MELWQQGDITYVLNAEPGSFAARFVEEHGPCAPHTAVVLPDGARATAFTRGEGWFAIVTEDDEILIYSRVTGNLRQRIAIAPE